MSINFAWNSSSAQSTNSISTEKNYKLQRKTEKRMQVNYLFSKRIEKRVRLLNWEALHMYRSPSDSAIKNKMRKTHYWERKKYWRNAYRNACLHIKRLNTGDVQSLRLLCIMQQKVIVLQFVSWQFVPVKCTNGLIDLIALQINRNYVSRGAFVANWK